MFSRQCRHNETLAEIQKLADVTAEVCAEGVRVYASLAEVTTP